MNGGFPTIQIFSAEPDEDQIVFIDDRDTEALIKALGFGPNAFHRTAIKLAIYKTVRLRLQRMAGSPRASGNVCIVKQISALRTIRKVALCAGYIARVPQDGEYQFDEPSVGHEWVPSDETPVIRDEKGQELSKAAAVDAIAAWPMRTDDRNLVRNARRASKEGESISDWPDDRKFRRVQARHLVLSCPCETRLDPQRMLWAAEATLGELFGRYGHRFILVLHQEHAENQHIHCLIENCSHDGRPIVFGPDGLMADVMRHAFAHYLAIAGIAVDASRKLDRPEILAGEVVRPVPGSTPLTAGVESQAPSLFRRASQIFSGFLATKAKIDAPDRFLPLKNHLISRGILSSDGKDGFNAYKTLRERNRDRADWLLRFHPNRFRKPGSTMGVGCTNGGGPILKHLIRDLRKTDPRPNSPLAGREVANDRKPRAARDAVQVHIETLLKEFDRYRVLEGRVSLCPMDDPLRGSVVARLDALRKGQAIFARTQPKPIPSSERLDTVVRSRLVSPRTSSGRSPNRAGDRGR